MNNIICVSGLVFIVFQFFCSCVEPSKNTTENSPFDHTKITNQLDSIGHHFMDKGKLMGLSIAVAKQGNVIYSNGFGHVDSALTSKTSSENIFLLASVSKLVGATMIMKLAEEKKLSLENTLAELLPDFPNKDQAKQIKLKHLLNHTAGLQDYASVIDSVFLETKIDPVKQDYYDFFRGRPLDFAPGTHFNYSNSGYALMAMIIEQATGNEFEKELDRIINTPTGLNIKLIKANLQNPKLSTYFELQDSLFIHQAHWTWIKGDGGLTTTASELAQFAFFWSNGSIISKESFEYMCNPTILIDGISTGYGMGVRTGIFEGEPVVGHTGGNKSGHSIMQYFPDNEISVAVFVNTDNTNTDALYIAGIVDLAIFSKKTPNLENLEVKNEDLSRFLGEYHATNSFYYGPGNVSIVKYENDPKLYRKKSGSDSKGVMLYYLGNNTFGYEPFPLDRVVFQSDVDGNIVAYNNFWNGFKKGGLFRKLQ